MKTGRYKLADVVVQIDSLYDEVHEMCREYRTKLPATLHVSVTGPEIEQEAQMSDEQRKTEGLPPQTFPPSYLETLTVYRKIATAMLQQGVLLMHGSAIAVDGKAYLFTALSGTGKSTHVRLWRKLFGERAMMVNDDKPLIRVKGVILRTNVESDSFQPYGKSDTECPVIYGTPWDGKHHLSNNIAVPLKAIVLLERGEVNTIEEVDAKTIFPTLMQQTFRPDDAMGSIRMMQLIGELAKHVKFYDLHCNMDPEAAIVASRIIL